jgi:hypothetical protein
MESPGCLLWILDSLTLFGVLAIRGWRVLLVALIGVGAVAWHYTSESNPFSFWLLIAACGWFVIEGLFIAYELTRGRKLAEVLQDSADWHV